MYIKKEVMTDEPESSTSSEVVFPVTSPSPKKKKYSPDTADFYCLTSKDVTDICLGLEVKGVTHGGFKDKENDDFHFVILLKNSKPLKSNFWRCRHCMSVLKGDGGHFSRHLKSHCSIKKTMDVERKEAPIVSKSSLKKIIAKFVVDSGSSFNMVDANYFRKFVGDILRLEKVDSCVNYDDIIPHRHSVSETISEMLEEQRKIISEMLGPVVESSFFCLVSDFGKINVDLYSLKMGFIDVVMDSENVRKMKLRTLAIGMRPVIGIQKNADAIYQIVTRVFANYNWKEEYISNSFFVADYAMNMRTAGNRYFVGYVRCFSHWLNICVQHIFEPYARTHMSDDDINDIATIKETIEACKKLAPKLKKNEKMMKTLTSSVSEYSQTRWMSVYNVVSGILKNVNNIVGNDTLMCDDPDAMKLIKKLNDSRDVMTIIIEVLSPFHEANLYSQKEDPTIHQVVPLFCGLIDVFQKMRIDLNETRKLLAKSAIESILFNDDIITPLHCIAYCLDPRRPLDPQNILYDHGIGINIKNLALDSLRAQSTILKLDSFVSNAANTNNNTSSSFISKYTQCEPVKEYSVVEEFEKYLLVRSPLAYDEYWPANETTFPKLYKIVMKTFSVLSSEACCERSFSLAKNVYTKGRKSLDLAKVESILLAHERSKQKL